MELKLRNILMMLVPTTIISISFFWWKHKMIQFKSVKDDTKVHDTIEQESETTVEGKATAEACTVVGKALEDVAVDSFDNSMTLQDFNHTPKRKREDSSCDEEEDSAYVEDLSSDTLSMCGSDTKNDLESKTSVKKEVIEEICSVVETPLDFVEVDTFDDSMMLQDFNQTPKRKREPSSCDGDSAYVEDFSSDNVSVSGSDNSNKTPTISEDPICEEIILPVECEDTETPPNNNTRGWFGPALDICPESQDKFAHIMNWGSQPVSDFEGDIDEINPISHDVVRGVAMEEVSDVLEKEYNERKAKINNKKADKPSRSSPRKSPRSPKKSPKSPKKKSYADSPKPTKSPKHKRSPRRKDERNLDKPWREDSEQPVDVPENDIDTFFYPNDYAVIEYLIPDDLCGKVIGKHGKAVKDINEKTGAYVCIESEKVECQCILSISGLFSQVEEAEKILLSKYKVSMQKYFADMPKETSVGNVSLSITEYVNVIVTAVINAGDLCLQIFGSEIDENLVQLQNGINDVYSVPPQKVFYHDTRKPKIGEICISFIDNIWCRVKVQEYVDEQVVVVFIDYGGNVIVPWQMLYKIRKEFLKLPAQAVQCYLADSYPLPGQDDYSYSANLTVNQMVEGKVLKACVHSVYDDVPCVELFYTKEENNMEMSVNSNLIEWGLVSAYAPDVDATESVGIEQTTEPQMVVQQ